MTDRMTVFDLHKPGDPEDMHPFEDGSRLYRAYRGKRTGGGRVSSLLFVPQKGTHMRRLPLAHLQLTDVAFDGSEIIMEFLHLTAVIAGRNLLSVESGIAAGWIAALEAFNPDRRDAPANGSEPFIERIQFFMRDAEKAKARPDKSSQKPQHEPETRERADAHPKKPG